MPITPLGAKRPNVSDDRSEPKTILRLLALALAALALLLGGLCLFLRPTQPPKQWFHRTWEVQERSACVTQVNLEAKGGYGFVLLAGVDGPRATTTLSVDSVKVHGPEVAFSYRHRGRVYWNGLALGEGGEAILYWLEVPDGVSVGAPGEPGTVWPAFVRKAGCCIVKEE
jgi:hypothetical protein